MSNPEDAIVIPRSELPDVCSVGAYVSGPTVANAYASSAHAAMMRTQAYERLAIAEDIDRILAQQADEKLRDEAFKLCAKATGMVLTTGPSARIMVEYWLKVALAAREVYGAK